MSLLFVLQWIPSSQNEESDGALLYAEQPIP